MSGVTAPPWRSRLSTSKVRDKSTESFQACTRQVRYNNVDDAKPTIKRGSYLGPSLPSCFLISGLSYKTTFNSELRISSFPLYSI